MNSRDTFSLFKKGILTALGKKLVLADNTINLSANKTVVGNANKLMGYDASGVPSALATPSGGIWKEISRSTLSGVYYVEFKDLPTAYKAFRLTFFLNSSSGNDYFSFIASKDNGVNYVSSSYHDTILSRGADVTANSAAYARFAYSGNASSTYAQAQGVVVINGLVGSSMGSFSFNGISNSNSNNDYSKLNVVSGGLFGTEQAEFNAFRIVGSLGVPINGQYILEGLL